MSRVVPPKLRFDILQRDRFACQYCGRHAPYVVLHCDHVQPVALGGSNDPENLVTSCVDCNSGKGARFARLPDGEYTADFFQQYRTFEEFDDCAGKLEFDMWRKPFKPGPAVRKMVRQLLWRYDAADVYYAAERCLKWIYVPGDVSSYIAAWDAVPGCLDEISQ